MARALNLSRQIQRESYQRRLRAREAGPHPLKPRALTLMEVMLALGLLALVVIGVMVVLIGGLSQLNQASDMAQARQLATQELERIRRPIRWDWANTIWRWERSALALDCAVCR